MASFATQARRGFAVGLAARVAIEAVSIPAAFFLARLLTPEDFGVFAAAGIVIVVAQRVTNFGFNTGLVRLREVTEAHTSSVFVVNVLIAVAAWLVLTALSPLLAKFFRSPEAAAVIPVAALSFVLASPGSVPHALLSRDLRFPELLLRDSIASWTSAITSVLLAWAGARYWALVYGQLLGTLVSTILRFHLTRWRPTTRVSIAAIRELWSFAFGIQVKRILETGAAYVDNLIVGRFLGIVHLGLYDKAFTTMNRGVAMISALGPTVSMSILAKLQDDAVRFRSANRKVLLSTSLMAFPIFWATAAFARPLFYLLFGPQWVASIVPFQILCIAAPLKLLGMYLGSTLESKGRVWGNTALQALHVLLVAAGVAAGTRWDLPGAAAGVLLASVVVTILMCYLVRRVADFTWADLLAPQVPGILCGLIVVIAVVPVGLVVRTDFTSAGSVAILLALQAIVALLAFGAFLLLYPAPAIRELVRDTVSDFAPRWIRTRSSGEHP